LIFLLSETMVMQFWKSNKRKEHHW